MRVLLTNDDGIGSAGLHALAHAFEPVADVFVVAPEHERSATGHAITLHKPLRAVSTTIPGSSVRAWATNGTPADCVALGTLSLLPEPPEIVVSGINVGPNMGRDLTYSGTVSGAMEAAIIGVPGIALSIGAFRNPVFDVAARFAVYLAQMIVSRGLPADTLLNVNVPNLPAEEIAGVEITHQGDKRYISRLEQRTDPRGRPYYWLSGEPGVKGDREGTDTWALAHKRISVTPIGLDMTSLPAVTALKSWGLTVESPSTRSARSGPN
jgi:5'-nucleotidase